jgi:transposase
VKILVATWSALAAASRPFCSGTAGAIGAPSPRATYYDQWVRMQTWSVSTLTATHQHYVRAVDEARARLTALNTDLDALATTPRYAEAVGRLRCFRGIDTLSALILTVELGDPRRFASAPALMAFVGLVPAEHSSGPKVRRGGITRTGNAHLRRILVEAAWHDRHQPYRGHLLRRRQAGQPQELCG